MSALPLILASASARRRQILSHLQVPFQCLVSEADETLPHGTAAADAVALLSCRKAWAAAHTLTAQGGKGLVLGADTVVCQDGVILGKPKDTCEARKMLSSYSGRTHFVYSGVAIIAAPQARAVSPLDPSILPKSVTFYQDTALENASAPPPDGAWVGFFSLPIDASHVAYGAVVRSCVHFRAIDKAEIEASIAAKEPFDKAGGYGIQDRAALWIEGITGDYFNVVGLPVCALDRVFFHRFSRHLSDIGKEIPS